MSKKGKRLLRLFKKPSPTDFTWDELISVMDAADFTNSCSGGSHYMFEHKGGIRVGIVKSHPNGILKQYQLDNAKEALEQVGHKPEGI